MLSLEVSRERKVKLEVYPYVTVDPYQFAVQSIVLTQSERKANSKVLIFSKIIHSRWQGLLRCHILLGGISGKSIPTFRPNASLPLRSLFQSGSVTFSYRRALFLRSGNPACHLSAAPPEGP
jgi:hypothetical protein